ncbi:MAG: endonuclease [Flavobacteriaceae bacterium]|nr:endonuclease [Flavobacteriaceae bacterium]
MIRKIPLLVGLFISFSAFAQPPANYYSTTTGLSGFALKSELNNIITNGHVWDALSWGNLWGNFVFADSDVYFENDNTVLDIYSENPAGIDPYNYNHNTDQCGNVGPEGTCYNREHIFPQGFFNSQEPMRSDIHHVFPTDGFVNNGRGNLLFGEVDNASTTYLNSTRKGNSATPGYDGEVFEPIDEFKGDVARAMLYFAVRYENNWNDAGWDVPSTINNPINGTSAQFYETWFLNMLLEWHEQDPVSQKEIDRNNIAFSVQGNRNPFVDIPQFAQDIWADPNNDNLTPIPPSNLIITSNDPTSVVLTWQRSSDNVAVTGYEIEFGPNGFTPGSGTLVNAAPNLYDSGFVITGLAPNTEVCARIRAFDATGNFSSFTPIVCFFNGSGSGNELFISEYVEGSGSNKAIEIANFSGSAINLSDYSIARNTNGGATWGSQLNLSGTLNDQDVFVVVNTNAVTPLQNLADLVSAADVMLFNGNDPVGLFKNNTLIDIVGDFNGGSADFAKDVTLVRKPTITSPNVNFDIVLEWDSFPIDTFTDIGQHTVNTLSATDLTPEDFKIFPNPSKGHFFIQNISESTQVFVYDLTGRLLQKRQTEATERLSITIEKPGVYLLNLRTKDNSKSFKLVVQ